MGRRWPPPHVLMYGNTPATHVRRPVSRFHGGICLSRVSVLSQRSRREERLSSAGLFVIVSRTGSWSTPGRELSTLLGGFVKQELTSTRHHLTIRLFILFYFIFRLTL